MGEQHRLANSSASHSSYFGKYADKYLMGRCVCYVVIVVVETGTGAGLGSLVGDFIGGLREILIVLGVGSTVGFGLVVQVLRFGNPDIKSLSGRKLEDIQRCFSFIVI